MLILSFKNGDKIKISAVIAHKLYEQIVNNPQGAKNFQFFTDDQTREVVLAINVSEISSISSKENII